MVDVKEKMAQIQSIFIVAKEKSLITPNLSELNQFLQNTSPEFISVAYEAAAMGIAINSIKETDSLTNWNDFYQQYGLRHGAQVHVGLGWALSELDLKASTYLTELDPILKYRVIDGYGYYEGKFKRRQAVRTQQIPSDFDKLSTRAYNQGLGRSFWYTAQGEAAKLAKLITIFPEERHPDMWRGAGVAIAYVGGIETSVINELLTHSEDHQTAFKCGISLAIQSREKAKTTTMETETICNLVLDLNCTEVSKKLLEIEKETNSSTENIYFDWIKKIETGYA